MLRPRENYTTQLSIALILTLSILVTFQVYVGREPERIRADVAADRETSITAGGTRYSNNCAACHGGNGEGGVGPALNSRALLSAVPDETLFSLINTGVPRTNMPAWGQVFGGPFTNEEVTQLVIFIRAWEASAPEIVAVA